MGLRQQFPSSLISLTESIVEYAALAWIDELVYAVGHGPHLAPGEPAVERDSFGEDGGEPNAKGFGELPFAAPGAGLSRPASQRPNVDSRRCNRWKPSPDTFDPDGVERSGRIFRGLAPTAIRVESLRDSENPVGTFRRDVPISRRRRGELARASREPCFRPRCSLRSPRCARIRDRSACGPYLLLVAAQRKFAANFFFR